MTNAMAKINAVAVMIWYLVQEIVVTIVNECAFHPAVVNNSWCV